MKTLEEIFYTELGKTRKRLYQQREASKKDPRLIALKNKVAERLGLPQDTDIKVLVDTLDKMTEEERKEKLDGLIK
ncbi:MAG TPA: hypothetical protein DCS93_34190 [Microscillaceae bacterium]|nr:hypothetical protein [Microscillaceae bacterium]